MRCYYVKIVLKLLTCNNVAFVLLGHVFRVARHHLGEVIDHVLLVVEVYGRNQEYDEDRNVYPVSSCQNMSRFAHVRYDRPVTGLLQQPGESEYHHRQYSYACQNSENNTLRHYKAKVFAHRVCHEA